MAIVIVSAGGLARSRLRTLTTRRLATAAGVLALISLVGGFALGFRLGDARHANDGVAPEIANLDPRRPGDQALISEIGRLSGRMVRLEATADRLAKRVGTTEPSAASAADVPADAVAKPAGGPLLEPLSSAVSGTGAPILRHHRDLDRIEASLEEVAALVVRNDLDEMAFPSREPIPGIPMSSGFGRRIDPFTRQLALHAGVDFVAPYGTPILASAGGRVRHAGPYGAYGRTVEIDHGDGLVTRYGHASRVLVRVGDVLLPGHPIALVGSSGRSTGSHLHFEILRDGTAVPPRPYLASDEF
jgi:murein DD-endopeptidase MepM/ murein hydrolase activator NlpD